MTFPWKSIALGVGVTMTFLLNPHDSMAAMGRCTLQVDGRTYLNGSCSIDVDAGGSFSIGAANNGWFAFVSVDSDHPGTALGYWNGIEAESHAHDNLGVLTKQGACWTNSRAKVCAYAQPNGQKRVLIDQRGGAKLEILNVEQHTSNVMLDTIRITLPDGSYNEDKLIINCSAKLVFDDNLQTEIKIDLENGPKSGELARYEVFAFSCLNRTN